MTAFQNNLPKNGRIPLTLSSRVIAEQRSTSQHTHMSTPQDPTATTTERSLTDAIATVGSAIRDIEAVKDSYAAECNNRIKALRRVEDALYVQRRDLYGTSDLAGIMLPSFAPEIEAMLDNPINGL